MGQKQAVEQQVRALVQPILQSAQVTLWDVTFEKEGASWFLRVFIDQKENPVTIQDCETVSRALSDVLDDVDPISQSYYLEVSSAGLGRKLVKEEHFAAFLGSEVMVKTYRAIDGQKEFVGLLQSYENGTVTLDMGDETKQFDKKDYTLIKLNDDLDLF